MSHREGSIGRIEKHGQFYTLRMLVRIDGEERNRHIRITICPLKQGSPGWLNSSQRTSRAREIIRSLQSESS
jgi:hypothetical protein